MQNQTGPLQTDEHGFVTLPVPRLQWWKKFRLHAWIRRHQRRWHGHRREKHYMLLGGAGLVGLAGWLLMVNFIVPSSLTFSFAGPTCAFNPLPLPRLTEHRADDNFIVESLPTVSLFGYPLFSHKSCVQAKQAPTPGDTARLALAPLANPLLHKQISVKVGELPSATPRSIPEDGVSIGAPLEFLLSQADQVFAYQLVANQQTSPCQAQADKLACPLGGLGLKQGASYPFKLERLFGESPAGTVIDSSLTTLDPVVLTASSIAGESTVYHKPTGLELTFNKAPVSVTDVRLKTVEPAGEDVATSFELAANILKVSFGRELERETWYELLIGQLTADDGSQLVTAPLTHRFRTSGGPQVTGSSVGSSKVAVGASIVLTFDTNLAGGQNLTDFVNFDGSGINASITAKGNQITINPNSDMPRCSDFSVNVKAGLANEHGVGGGKAWSLKSRTVCQVAFSIGTSVKGRGITAYKFGTGSSKIVFVGGMHGNEKSSVNTLNGLIDYLESRARDIPAHRSIIVIPNHNPDGYSSSRRTNANNVDLNRNFPSNDWQTAVQMPGNQFLPNGGGLSPLDQPESAALASFIQSENPRLVLTYHAVARVVISNDAGDSVALAQKYAADTGYEFSAGADSHGQFEYATTGEFEDWLADREGIPGILVELSSMSANQFNTHKNAMWNITTLP